MPENISPVATRRKRYERSPSQEKLIGLTPTKVQMLRFLAELRFLSLPQLAKLCCPSERQGLSEKSARRHMRELFDAGLVDVLPVSRAALAPPGTPNDASLLYGSAPNIYAPTSQGFKLLRQAGIVEEELLKHPAPTYGPRNSLFLAHELAVRDVRVWLEEAAQVHGGDHRVLCWRDGNAAAIDLWSKGTTDQVRPDAWFVYNLQFRPSPAVVVGLVEVDRGTERGNARWDDKIYSYVTLFSSGQLPDITGYKNARVVVVCPSTQRCAAIAQQIRDKAGAYLDSFWIGQHDISLNPDLASLVWQRPSSSAKLPFAPAKLLHVTAL